VKDDKRLIYKSTVKELYGLTDGMIKRVGKPDKAIEKTLQGVTR
jgi:hypothetical protein